MRRRLDKELEGHTPSPATYGIKGSVVITPVVRGRAQAENGNDFSAFCSVIERLSLLISHVFKAAWNKEPDRVGRYRLCAALD